MKIYDFNPYKQNDKVYGGMSGRKLGITINGKDFLLKFPGNLKVKDMKNISLSYSNSPTSEYLGSQIYKILEIPVHNTYLGVRNGKIVVACEDFLERGEQLQEFGALKVTMEPALLDSLGNETDGLGTDLKETLLTVRTHPLLESLSNELECRFWDMFIVDALIGNPDRNNGNWGIIKTLDGEKKLAPVYDNGNSFNNKWTDEKMEKIHDNLSTFIAESYKGRRCIFESEKRRINPYQFIQNTTELKCIDSIKKIVPKMILNRDIIIHLVDAFPKEVMSDIRKEFCRDILQSRIDEIFIPTLEKIKEREQYFNRSYDDFER